MNNDLISRSTLHSAISLDTKRGTYGEFMDGSEVSFTSNEVHAMLDEAPAVDAVIPVRCAQCKHFKRNLENDTYCSSVNGLTDPQEDDFCSYGEKRGSEHE